MKLKFRFATIGVLLGLFISLGIFLAFWVVVAESDYRRKVFYYDGFVFWQKCKQEGKTDLQAATERYRILHDKPYFRPEMHPDVKSGHPEGFIRGTLGYELRDGFGYGEKPGRIETFFERMVLKETLEYIAMLLYIPYIVMLVSPFVCGVIGYIVVNSKISRKNKR